MKKARGLSVSMHRPFKSTAKRSTVFCLVVIVGMIHGIPFLPSLWLKSVTGVGILLAIWYLYKSRKSANQGVWHQQLSAVIQKMSAPVLLIDNDLQVTFANDSLWRLPFASLLNQKKNFAEILAAQSSAKNEAEGEIERFSTLLKGLSGKIKIPMQWGGNAYEWAVTPLFSPNFQRWSTLVECVAKTDEGALPKGLPLNQILEQIATPFFFVNTQNQIAFVNNTLKMELLQYQKFLQIFYPQVSFDLGQMTIKQFLLLIKKENSSFAELLKTGNCAAKLGEDEFNIVFQPLWSADNKNLGTLVLWHKAINQQLSTSGTQLFIKGITQATNPIVIINNDYYIEHYSTSFLQMFATLKTENWQAQNLLTMMQNIAESTALCLKRALESGKRTTFLAQHADAFYDWTVNPIKNGKKIAGFVIEAITPSMQEIKGLKESWQRLQNKKLQIEKELTKFTRSLAEVKLYQKGSQLGLEHLKIENYQHPLLQNSTKHLQHIAGNLETAFTEIERLNTLLSQESSKQKAQIAPVLPQMEVLSSSIVRNVQEAQQEFERLGQELNKFTSLVKEQKGLNEAIVKPVSQAIQLSEQGIKQSITQAEAVTLAVQQLHENQSTLIQIQEFLAKVEEFGAKVSAQQLAQMHQHALKLVDKAKQMALAGKTRLGGLLPHVDEIKSNWQQTLENLKYCLQLATALEQIAVRGQDINELSCERSQQLSSRIHSLLELTQKIQHKANGHDGKHVEQRVNLFEQIVYEVDETKKKAEDVLLEGFNRS